MAVYDYAEKFNRQLQERYAIDLKSDFLTHSNQDIKFIDAQTIRVPDLTTTGFYNHTRTSVGGFQTGAAMNSWTPYKLEWDRSVEFPLDPMDVDETNLTVSMAKFQNRFEKENVIPEKDSYRFSKLYKEAKAKGSTIDTEALTTANILAKFDAYMEAMDEAGVDSGRKLVVTNATYTMLKQAEGIQRVLDASSSKKIDRRVYSLEDVEIIKVPSIRLKTNYEDKEVVLKEGVKGQKYLPADDAKQINMILVDPSAVICKDKYSYIKVFTPGHDSRTADNYLYQSRYYSDLFVIEAKKAGVIINAEAEA